MTTSSRFLEDLYRGIDRLEAQDAAFEREQEAARRGLREIAYWSEQSVSVTHWEKTYTGDDGTPQTRRTYEISRIFGEQYTAKDLPSLIRLLTKAAEDAGVDL